MNITSIKDIIKIAYKKTVPPVIDYSGIYDSIINDDSHKLLVPMYHRIIDNPNDDPFNMGMCVTKETFEKQLQYFSDNYKSILLRDYIQNTNYQKNNGNYISLTFDDGYKDIITIAKEYLDKYKIKTTIFICGHIFNPDNEFWWDTLMYSFSNTKCSVLDLSELKLGFPSELIQLNHKTKKLHLVELVKYLWTFRDVNKVNDIALFIQNQLIGSSNTIEKLDEHDIIQLHKSGYEIAAHTMTHPNLPLLNIKQQIKEISNSKNILEEIIKDKIYGFAYPAGLKNEKTEELVNKCGFEYAVSTNNGVNRSIKNFSIERVGMPETAISDIKRCIYNYCKQ